MTLSTIAIALLLGLAPSTQSTSEPPKPAKVERIGAPYLLDVCVVSGEKLPAGGGEVMIMDGETAPSQKGREVRFCCKRCMGAFSKDPARFVPKIDELIIADQLPRYPATATCSVMPGEALPDPKGPDARDCKLVVTHNRLVRLCCGKCVRQFRRDPAKYIAILDTSVIAEAKASGTIKTCAVNGRPLHDRSYWFVLGDRAVGTCCRGCEPKAMADPRGTLARLDASISKPKS